MKFFSPKKKKTLEICRFFSEKMGILCQNILFYFYFSQFGEISHRKKKKRLLITDQQLSLGTDNCADDTYSHSFLPFLNISKLKNPILDLFLCLILYYCRFCLLRCSDYICCHRFFKLQNTFFSVSLTTLLFCHMVCLFAFSFLASFGILARTPRKKGGANDTKENF